MYGEGATTSAVEHRLRPLRRTAEEMRNQDHGSSRSKLRTHDRQHQPKKAGTNKGADSPADTDSAETPSPKKSGQKAPASSPIDLAASTAKKNTSDARQMMGTTRVKGANDGNKDTSDVQGPAKRQKTVHTDSFAMFPNRLSHSEPHWPSDQNAFGCDSPSSGPACRSRTRNPATEQARPSTNEWQELQDFQISSTSDRTSESFNAEDQFDGLMDSFAWDSYGYDYDPFNDTV